MFNRNLLLSGAGAPEHPGRPYPQGGQGQGREPEAEEREQCAGPVHREPDAGESGSNKVPLLTCHLQASHVFQAVSPKSRRCCIRTLSRGPALPGKMLRLIDIY